MAYGNWGAYVWKNGDLEKDCCDASIDIGDLQIGGHAVINCDNLIFEFYKAYFPVIYEKQSDGTYKKWEEDSFIRNYGVKELQYDIDINFKVLPEDKIEPTIDDFYYSFNRNNVIILNYKGYKIEFFGDRFETNMLNTFEITTPEDDKWYCVYGMSFGNGGYEKRCSSKVHNKYLWYDEDEKEYWYDCKNIDRKMQRAYDKDRRNNEFYWIKKHTKEMLRSILKLKFRNVRWQMGELIDEIQEMLA